MYIELLSVSIGFTMSNYILVQADRATHLRIVVVSVIAAMLVVGVGVSARTPASNGALQLEENALPQKAGKPAAVSSRQSATIR